jgi:hypothetical protein
VDFGILKNFFLTERFKLTFRTEAFNLVNRVNLGSPQGNLNNANVARITSASGPRVLRMALRFHF